MSRRFEVRIEKLVYGGAGLGRHAGKVVFVPFSAPGDLLLAESIEEKKNFIRAVTIKVLEAGQGRRSPRCSHFGVCGGCQWQQLEYPRQLEAKRRILEEVFHHRFPETLKLAIDMRPSPEEYAYRSRARIQVRGFGTAARVGFFRSQSHVIEDIPECPLFRPSLNRGLLEVRRARSKYEGNPGLRQFDIACAEEEGVWMSAEVESELDTGISALSEAGGDREHEPVLTKRIGEYVYSLTPSAFFQANDFMVSLLIQRIEALVQPIRSGAALDLFAGVGLFSLPLGRRFETVVAVENSPIAARLCAQNADAAGFSNVRVVCADVSAWLKAVGSVSPPAFNAILLDPPRSGTGTEIMDHIATWAPECILYVSCDPQTLCRDLAFLPSRAYRIDHVEGLDLFPQTYHFETIVRLQRC
ncbi:MAG TPA: class I SAM-dependent RNA methyltransferase [Acidobacteriota bacterium]|nr:class I SAM-dependent RNA methyltransferase [Acidobacteriota bacterium]